MDPKIFNFVLLGLLSLIALAALLQLFFIRRKDGALREEVTRTLADVRELREDVQSRFNSLLKSMVPAETVTRGIDERLERVRVALEEQLRAVAADHSAKLELAGSGTRDIAEGQREDNASALEKIKESLVSTLDQFTQYLNQMVTQSLADNANSQRAQIAAIVEHLTHLIDAAEQKLATFRNDSDLRMQRIQSEIEMVSKFQQATRVFGATLAGDFEAPEANHYPPVRLHQQQDS